MSSKALGELRQGNHDRVFAAYIFLIAAWGCASFPWILNESYIPWDAVDAFFPQAYFVVSSALHGEWPWWNPHVFSGIPVLGDPQSLIFTPITFIGIISGKLFNIYIFNLTVLACPLLGALALFQYAKTYSDSVLFPLLGALVFMLGGVATSRLEHVPEIISYAILPIQLLAIRRICARPSASTVILLAAMLLAGVLNPNQVVFLSFFILPPFFFIHLRESENKKKALAAAFIALLIAAAFSLPLFFAVRNVMDISTRQHLSAAASSFSSLPVFDFASIFLPGLFGVLTPHQGIWAPTDISQDYLYIGVVPAWMVMRSLTLKDLHTVGRVSQALLALVGLYALGIHTEFYGFLYRHIPGFSFFRRPADAAFYINFCIALIISVNCFSNKTLSHRVKLIVWLLASVLLLVDSKYLLEYASRRDQLASFVTSLSQFSIRVVIFLILFFLIFKLVKRNRRTVLTCYVMLFAVTDLVFAGRIGQLFCPGYDTNEVARLYRHPDSLRDGGNSALLAAIRFVKTHERGTSGSLYRFEAVGGPLAASLPLVYGLYGTQGYNPIKVKWYARIFGAEDLQVQAKAFSSYAPNYQSRYYKLAGLRYVMLDVYIEHHYKQFGEVGDRLMTIRQRLVNSAGAKRVGIVGGYEVWRLSGAYPKAKIIDFRWQDRRHDSQEQFAGKGACHITSYRNTFISLACFTDSSATVALNDTFAPGWRACINGKNAAVTRYRGVFRSVRIPKGHSVVEFVYRPMPFLQSARCRS